MNKKYTMISNIEINMSHPKVLALLFFLHNYESKITWNMHHNLLKSFWRLLYKQVTLVKFYSTLVIFNLKFLKV